MILNGFKGAWLPPANGSAISEWPTRFILCKILLSGLMNSSLSSVRHLWHGPDDDYLQWPSAETKWRIVLLKFKPWSALSQWLPVAMPYLQLAQWKHIPKGYRDTMLHETDIVNCKRLERFVSLHKFFYVMESDLSVAVWYQWQPDAAEAHFDYMLDKNGSIRLIRFGLWKHQFMALFEFTYFRHTSLLDRKIFLVYRSVPRYRPYKI